MRAFRRIAAFASALLLLMAAGLLLFVESAGSGGERSFRARGCALCHAGFGQQPLRALEGWQAGHALRPRVQEALRRQHPLLAAGAEEALAEFIIAQQYAPLAAAQAGQAGERLYLAKCAACHGRNGEGQAGAYPPLMHSEWLHEADKLARLPEILAEGLRGPITVKGERWDAIMNAPGLCDEAGREAVIRYVHGRFGLRQQR